jgi:hypothetical protein
MVMTTRLRMAEEWRNLPCRGFITTRYLGYTVYESILTLETTLRRTNHEEAYFYRVKIQIYSLIVVGRKMILAVLGGYTCKAF